jgi:hypothetical protein
VADPDLLMFREHPEWAECEHRMAVTWADPCTGANDVPDGALVAVHSDE